MTLDAPKGMMFSWSTDILRLLKVSGLSLLLLLSPKAIALEFQCEFPGDTRFLRLEIPGEKNLCEVSVSYEKNGERKVQWYADKDTLFCSLKIHELKEKYENNWKFVCEQWPDLDGIDSLSKANRKILDTQLKAIIEKGKTATPTFTVERVKAVASNSVDKQPSSLALQFFLSNGDTTQIINGDGKTWKLLTTIDNIASLISSDLSVNTALVSAISDSGTLEVQTSITTESEQNCYGQQAFKIASNIRPKPLTQHQYLCEKPLADSAQSGN